MSVNIVIEASTIRSRGSIKFLINIGSSIHEILGGCQQVRSLQLKGMLVKSIASLKLTFFFSCFCRHETGLGSRSQWKSMRTSAY